MRHARSDYNRIQDPANLIDHDEPVFLVRAKDEFAPRAVLDYASRCETRGLTEQAASLRQWAQEMFRWQEAHGSQQPTVPGLDGQPTEEEVARG